MIRWLLENPLILILLGGWLLSVVGNVMTKAAQKAARERQGQRPPPDATVDREPRPVVRPAAPSAEDIGREIRRILGAEVETPRPAAPPPKKPEPVRSPTPAPPRRTLAEEMEERDRKRIHLGALEGHAPTVGEELSHRHLAHLETRPTRRPDRRRRRARPEVDRRGRRRLDLDDPAALLIGLEVFGKPLALRHE